MKTTLLLCTIFYFLSLHNVQSQTNDIHLSGSVDSSIIKLFQSDTLIIKIHDSNRALLNSQDILKVHLNTSGKFKLKISPATERTYLSFWMSKKNGKGNLLRINYKSRFFYLDEMYLFQYRDSVTINFQEDGTIYFYGKGADRLNCQFKIFNMQIKSPSITSMITELFNQKKYLEALNFQNAGLDYAIDIRLKILESYKHLLSNEIYQILYLDAISSAEYEGIYPLWNKTLTPIKEESLEAQKIVQQYFLKYRMPDVLNDENRSFIYDSAYYLEYLFEMEWNKYKLFTDKPLTGNSFKDIYSIIKSKYQGQLRSKLLLICLRKLNRYFSQEIASNINQIFEDFKNTGYESTIINWAAKYGKAYPFEFEDEKGKVHKLSDYRNKVIVMDFWFTGCIPCKKLNIGMHGIINQYKNRNDIVFISVSQDKQRDLWLNSLRTGEYTSSGMINLFTNGLGVNHPMLRFYNFFGAPYQVIIDKNGNMITTNPPRPTERIKLEYINEKYVFSDKDNISSLNSVAFMKILNDLLN